MGNSKWDFTATGKLEIQLEGQFSKRVAFRDGTRATVEDKLSDLLAELEGRELRAVEKINESKRLDDLYVAEREEIVREVRQRWLEDQRDVVLAAQVDARRRADEARALADRIERGAPDAEATNWVAWIRTRADQLDPTIDLRLPAAEDATPEDLAPYLREWPPTRSYRWKPRADAKGA